jgi:hypothetical protein
MTLPSRLQCLSRVSTRNHSRPLSIARYVHFRPIDSGTWVPGKHDPVANQHRKRQGLSRLRSSGREHISLLIHIHRLNLDHQGGALKVGQLRTRYKMGDVQTTHLSWIVSVYHP